MNDDELIVRVVGGDDMALRERFVRHAPMFAASLRTVLRAADVEDVLQETGGRVIGPWRTEPSDELDSPLGAGRTIDVSGFPAR
jgi:DNA-directed RNA polymerase specialized sigma24 family protein